MMQPRKPSSSSYRNLIPENLAVEEHETGVGAALMGPPGTVPPVTYVGNDTVMQQPFLGNVPRATFGGSTESLLAPARQGDSFQEQTEGTGGTRLERAKDMDSAIGGDVDSQGDVLPSAGLGSDGVRVDSRGSSYSDMRHTRFMDELRQRPQSPVTSFGSGASHGGSSGASLPVENSRLDEHVNRHRAVDSHFVGAGSAQDNSDSKSEGGGSASSASSAESLAVESLAMLFESGQSSRSGGTRATAPVQPSASSVQAPYLAGAPRASRPSASAGSMPPAAASQPAALLPQDSTRSIDMMGTQTLGVSMSRLPIGSKRPRPRDAGAGSGEERHGGPPGAQGTISDGGRAGKVARAQVPAQTSN